MEGLFGVHQMQNDLPVRAAPQAHINHKCFFKHRDVNGGETSFAKGLNPYKLIWVFIIGSVIGCMYEGIFCFFLYGDWMRRSGMLIGDFSQIYGLGAVMFVLMAYALRKQNKLTFFLAVSLMGGIYEYVCGVIQKNVFGSVSWNYSEIPGSIGEHANVFIALTWGLMGFMFISYVLPNLSEIIERIPNKLTVRSKRISFGKPITIIVTVFLIANLGITCLSQYRAYERQQGIPTKNSFSEWLDNTYPDEILDEKFPNWTYVNNTP